MEIKKSIQNYVKILNQLNIHQHLLFTQNIQNYEKRFLLVKMITKNSVRPCWVKVMSEINRMSKQINIKSILWIYIYIFTDDNLDNIWTAEATITVNGYQQILNDMTHTKINFQTKWINIRKICTNTYENYLLYIRWNRLYTCGKI